MSFVEQFKRDKEKIEDYPKKRRREKLLRTASKTKFYASEKLAEVDQEKYAEGWERVFGKGSKEIEGSNVEPS